MDEAAAKPLAAPLSPWIPPHHHHHPHAMSCPLAGHLHTCQLYRHSARHGLHPYPPPPLSSISAVDCNRTPYFRPNLFPLPSPFLVSRAAYAVPTNLGHHGLTVPGPATCLEDNGSASTTEEQTEHLDGEAEEEEVEAVFVLTDEWLEFFAKSEAKRRLQKRQKQKQRK